MLKQHQNKAVNMKYWQGYTPEPMIEKVSPMTMIIGGIALVGAIASVWFLLALLAV